MAYTYIPGHYINQGDRFKVTRPDGTIIYLKIESVGTITNGYADTFRINPYIHNSDFVLDWHNCYSFGNGVESNRIRDGYNKPFMTNGVRVSTIFEDYKEEHKKYGLIYSGLYNDTSGVNNLNQFVQAEKITKDINPIYGSIQKLHSRDTDLIALCEDKVLKIMANKDAVYNADGNIQLTATENVLGQTIPFIGEYGISKNPESFASENYRSYFVDKTRGAVLRLSKDGLTPISDHGMRDWFRDNLKNAGRVIGSFDDVKGDYNVTITSLGADTLINGNFDTGGVWHSHTPYGDEVTGGDFNNYTPGITSSIQYYGNEVLADPGNDDGAGVASNQLSTLTVAGNWPSPVYGFQVSSMQPLHYYYQNNKECIITHINGAPVSQLYIILTAAGQRGYDQYGVLGPTITSASITQMLAYWPNPSTSTGPYNVSVEGSYQYGHILPALNDGDVLKIAVGSGLSLPPVI